MNYIFQEHPNYLKEMTEAANTHHFIPVFRATKKAQNIYFRLEWIIKENREFKFLVEEFVPKTPNWSLLQTIKFGSLEIYSKKK